jgi:hypothetical protein
VQHEREKESSRGLNESDWHKGLVSKVQHDMEKESSRGLNKSDWHKGLVSKVQHKREKESSRVLNTKVIGTKDLCQKCSATGRRRAAGF